MLNKEFSKIPDLDKISFMFNKNQLLLLNKYLETRLNFSTKARLEEKEKILTNLNHFFNSLVEIQRKVVRDWFNFQLSCIDNKLLPCAKIAEFAYQNGLQTNIAISKDGESAILIFDDLEIAEQFQEKFKNAMNFEPKLMEVR